MNEDKGRERARVQPDVVTDRALDRARARYEAGDFKGCREAALAGLKESPDDVELLRLAGQSSLELDLDDAADHLRRVVELRPDDVDGWRALGEAYAAEGRTSEATDAFRRLLELRPDDSVALLHLGHSAHALGQSEEAISLLAQVAAREPAGQSTAVISLVEMYKAAGQPEEALAAAEKVAEAAPDDVLAVLDVAELSLGLGRLDQAAEAFERLREIDDLPDHEVYALHGMIHVELRRDDLPRALELATEAARVDRLGRTKDVLAFLEVQTGSGGDGAAPAREEVEGALVSSHAEHRRLHVEDRRLQAEDLLG